MFRLRARLKRGFTLIEIVLVLAVGLGIFVGGLIFFRQASITTEVDRRTRNILAINSEIKSQYRHTNSIPLLQSGEMNKFKIRSGLPAEAFDGLSISVNAGSGTMKAYHGYSINSLSVEVCERMLIQDLGQDAVAECLPNRRNPAVNTLMITYSGPDE